MVEQSNEALSKIRGRTGNFEMREPIYPVEADQKLHPRVEYRKHSCMSNESETKKQSRLQRNRGRPPEKSTLLHNSVSILPLYVTNPSKSHLLRLRES
jgi:hypothetical protein